MSVKNMLVLLIVTLFLVGCQINVPFSASSLPIQEVRKECVPVQKKLPAGFQTDGTILLGDFSAGAINGQIMTLTSETSQPVYWSDVPTVSNGASSPDSNLFAYTTIGEDNSSTLIVLDTKGKEQFVLPWDKKWGGFYWLNNHQIEFPYFWDGYWQGVSPISDVVDVVKGQREIIAPELKDPWLPGGPVVPMLVVWKTAYDPSLSLIGYMRGDEPEQRFVLWDLDNSSELWELNKWSTRTVRPAWAPDGKKLAVVVLNQKEDDWDRFELYLVDRDGRAVKWIDLRGYFKNASLNINWSPNGQYLAIVPNEEQPLLILDTGTREVLDYCLPANVGYSPVIWSPDSSQVILPRLSDSGYPSIVLDIKNKRATYITDDPKFIPIGWLSDPP